MMLPSTMKKNPKRMNMTNVNKTVAERLRDMADNMRDYCPYCTFDDDNNPHDAIGSSFAPRAHIYAELLRVQGSVPLLDKLFGSVISGRKSTPKTRHFLKVYLNFPDYLSSRWVSYPINFCPMCGRDLRGGE